MPLRITIEVIPHGDESKKFLVAQVDAENNMTGTKRHGNYNVKIIGPVHGGGVDQWSEVPPILTEITRDRGYFRQAGEIMERLQFIKTEPIEG